VKTGSAQDLVQELVEDVVVPTKGCTFIRHLFNADWQHSQYRELRDHLQEGQLLLVMDFAENPKSACQDEIKSFHFSKQ
jgi:hypothetical protein